MTQDHSAFSYEAMLDEYPDTMVSFGAGSITELYCYVLQNRINSAMLFAGGTSSANRSMGAVQSLFVDNPEFDLRLYAGIPPEPTVEDVRKMRAALEQSKPEIVIAVGGGSVMDAAKAAYLSMQTESDVNELFGVNTASTRFPEKEFKRIICIPTTSGTGSEVTPYSNIVDPESGVKKLIMEKQIIPSHAFVDPVLTHSMPQDLTVTTALDAFVHCIESVLNYRAENAHPDSVEWGLEGIRLIAQALPVVLKEPGNYIARTKLSAAAVLGGMCIRNRPTSLPHLCSFSFYGKVPHGVAVAALLPPFWQYYLESPEVRDITMKMSGIFSKEPEQTAEEIVKNCADFIAACKGPAKLSDLGCDRSIIAKVAGDAVQNPMKLQSCPRPVEPANAAEIITVILEKAW